jgi:altronate dehydratase
MDTPGYGPTSMAGMVTGGTNIICFITGRRSVFGCKPVPSIKLASNTPFYRYMEEDMDINCGTIADVEATSRGRWGGSDMSCCFPPISKIQEHCCGSTIMLHYLF